MTQETIKTGTTCIGMLYKDGVLIAADRRVSTYQIEADNFTKVFDISKNAVATVAGHAAAAQLFMRVLRSEVKLLELKNERSARVSEVAMILNSIQFGAARQGAVVGSILAGFDSKEGARLYDMSFDGTIVSHEGYVTNGSGSIYLKGVLDNYYKENMSEKEALELLEKCFNASFKNDPSSGGGFIAKIVTKEGIKEVERKKVQKEFVEEK